MYQEQFNLSPKDILEKEFKIDTRGYRLKEVDQYLDLIISDYEQFVKILKENAQKALENSTSILRNDLIRRASLASIEVAKARIIEELKLNKELHQKMIDESIEKLEGVEL